MYVIAPATQKIADENGYDIYPSKKKNKKLDVYFNDEFVGSIGDSRFKDYHSYLKEDRQLATERKRLYRQRHAKNKGITAYLSRLLLWT